MPTVEGKAYWASITRPNTTFDPVYQIDLAISDESAESLNKTIEVISLSLKEKSVVLTGIKILHQDWLTLPKILSTL